MAAPYWVSSAYAYGTNPTLPVPSGVQDHDLILVIAWKENFGTITDKSGWTKAIDVSTGYTVLPEIIGYARFADNEGSDLGVWVANGYVKFTIELYRDVGSLSDIIVGAKANRPSGGTSLVIPSITTTKDNSRVLSFTAIAQNAHSISLPAGETSRHEISGTYNWMRIADEAKATAGATGTRTVDKSTTYYDSVGFLVALPPAPEAITITSPAMVDVQVFEPSHPIILNAPATVDVQSFEPLYPPALGVAAGVAVEATGGLTYPIAIPTPAAVDVRAYRPAYPIAIPTPAAVDVEVALIRIGISLDSPAAVSTQGAQGAIVIPSEMLIYSDDVGSVGQGASYGSTWAQANTNNGFSTATSAANSSLSIGRNHYTDGNYYLNELWVDFDLTAIPTGAGIFAAEFSWEPGADASISSESFILRKFETTGIPSGATDWPFHSHTTGGDLASYSGGTHDSGLARKFVTLDPTLGIQQGDSAIRYALYSNAYDTTPAGDYRLSIHVARVGNSNPTLRILYVPAIDLGNPAQVEVHALAPIVAVSLHVPAQIEIRAFVPAYPIEIIGAAQVEVSSHIPSTVPKVLLSVPARINVSSGKITVVADSIYSQQVTDALTGKYGPVVIGWRFERRTIANEKIDDITDAVVEWSMTGDNSRASFRVMNLSVMQDAMPSDLNTLSNHIAPLADITIHEPGGTPYQFTVQCGLFALSVPERTSSDGTIKITCSDVGIHLSESMFESVYVINAGDNITDSCAAILDSIPGLRYQIGHNVATTPVQIIANPGDSKYTLVSNLLSSINQTPAKANRIGVLTSIQIVPANSRAINVSYTDTEWLIGDISEKTDLSGFANKIIATSGSGSADGDSLVSIATNTDPASPVSVTNLGRVIPRVIRPSAVPDQAALDVLARAELDAAAQGVKQGTIITQVDPRRDIDEVYELTDALFGYDHEKWVALKWSISSSSPTMTHDVSRIEQVLIP